MTKRTWRLATVAALAVVFLSSSLVALGSTTQTALAHGCTLTAGYYKNQLTRILAADPNFHLPYPANDSFLAVHYSNGSQTQNLAHALAILNYDPNMDGVNTPSDAESKLARAVMVSVLNTHNGVDAQQLVINTQNAGIAFLESHPYGSVLSASDAQTIIGWAALLDAYANGDNVTYGILGPGHCSS